MRARSWHGGGGGGRRRGRISARGPPGEACGGGAPSARGGGGASRPLAAWRGKRAHGAQATGDACRCAEPRGGESVGAPACLPHWHEHGPCGFHSPLGHDLDLPLLSRARPRHCPGQMELRWTWAAGARSIVRPRRQASASRFHPSYVACIVVRCCAR
jgi:hypothetical protein